MKDKGILVETNYRWDRYPDADWDKVAGAGYLHLGTTDGEVEGIAVYAPGEWQSYRYIGYLEGENEDD